MAEETPQERALKNAARRILGILEGKNNTFYSKKFEWIEDAETRPYENLRNRSNQLGLSDIFEYIDADISRDELAQYVREDEKQKYFEIAWNGAENFRTARDYFKLLSGDCNQLLTGGFNGTFAMGMAINKKPIDSKSLERGITQVKKFLAEFETHMESYAHALQHRLRQINAVQSYIHTVLEGQEGESLIDEEDPRKHVETLLETDTVEQAIKSKVQAYLERQGLRSPVILDHVTAAAYGAVSYVRGLDTTHMREYFDSLERNLRVNAKTCQAIQKYSADTRQHIDRIITQEKSTVGIE